MGRAKVKRGRRRVLFWIIAGFLIALCAGSILLLRSIALPQRYKGLIEARLKGITGRDIRIRRASLRFLGGMGIEFDDLVIKDWDGKYDFFRAKGLILQMKLLPLLRRQLRWKSLILEQPSIWLRRSNDGNINLWAKGNGPKPKDEGKYPHILGFLSSFAGGDIRIRKGNAHFIDDFLASGPTVLGVENLYIELSSLSMDAPIPFQVQAMQPNPKGPNGRIWISGEIGPLPDTFDRSKVRIAAEVQAKNINPLPFWPYYGHHTPMKCIGGFLDIHAHYEGDFSGLFRSRGEIRVKDVEFDYPQVFDTVLKPREFVVDYDVKMTMESLIIPEVSFRLPEIEIRGRGAIAEIKSPRRRIEAFASTGSFLFDGITKYIPLRILSPGFAKFMRDITRRGRGRIEALRIEGPIGDFSMLEDPEKADLIYGKMQLEGMAYNFAKAFRPVEDISGWVILDKGTMRFLDLKGYLGRSGVNASELTISQIYSSPQLHLDVNGEINARGIADIAKTGTFPGKGIPIGDISGRGDLQLTVTGGLSSSSRVSYDGHLLLRGANLSIQGIHLPITATSGKVVFSNDRLRFLGLRGKVGNSALWVNGQIENPWLGKPGRQRLKLSLRGELDLRECFSRILPGVSPRISKALTPISDISGGARLTLELRGSGDGFEGMIYKGRLSVGKAVFRHDRMVSSIHFLKGYIDFTQKMIRFSDMEARLHGSYLKIDGSVRDYLPWERAKIDLHIQAPNLNTGDFGLKKGGKGEWMWKGGIALPEFGRVTLRIDDGTWRYAAFSNLTADITLAEGRITLERCNCGVKGGEVDLTAWMDLGSRDEGVFALNPTLSRIDIGQFFRDFNVEERVWITGAFNLWGSLMGRGRNLKGLRESLEGKIRVRMEKGRIQRFHILSKIFSLLNVSQLLKGKLPELTGEGLPYNTITGEIEIAKGIARTENLLVDSDAMKITVIGEADIVRESLDLTVGLHPLGTVDTILSKVPVVGRILAGEDESIISYYVEVKGDFSNPKVKHIPLKSMEKGLIEIMRRVLETPMHIIPRGKNSNSRDHSGFPEDDGEPGNFP
jgi:uncharacterized protein YhdP